MKSYFSGDKTMIPASAGLLGIWIIIKHSQDLIYHGFVCSGKCFDCSLKIFGCLFGCYGVFCGILVF